MRRVTDQRKVLRFTAVLPEESCIGGNGSAAAMHMGGGSNIVPRPEPELNEPAHGGPVLLGWEGSLGK